MIVTLFIGFSEKVSILIAATTLLILRNWASHSDRLRCRCAYSIG
jgi:hypothetical protein